MKHLIQLASRSAWNRRLTLGLTLAAIAFSTLLLLGVERLRQDARENFALSVSGTDLIIGARTSSVQLLLHAIFHIGATTTNMRWSSYQELSTHPLVAWTIPITLGDSFHGYPVLGTTSAYFEHFQYGHKQALQFNTGAPFKQLFEVVLGAQAAAQLQLRVGAQITLQHGSGDLAHAEHADKPFTVNGILAPTGTPVDRTIHIPIEAIEAIHLDWQGGAPIPGVSISPEHVRKFDLTPKTITAILVGLKQRAAVFRMQRWVNTYPADALIGIMPALALDELWQVVSVVERLLLAVSTMVVIVGLIGLLAVILASLNERRRELAILRSVGASPRDLFILLTLEGLGITVVGALSGVALLTLLTISLSPWLQSHYGLVITLRWLNMNEIALVIGIISIGLLASIIPGYRAYRMSLADGLTPRL
jgi:putative ABC transport system permease protein